MPFENFARHVFVGALAAAKALSLSGAPARASGNHFDVTISTLPTRHMSLNDGIYSPTGDNAVLNVNDLTNALNAGALEVTTGNGAGGKERGTIDVQAAFHWVSGNALTLDAYRSIRVEQPVTDGGTGALAIATHDGSSQGRLEFSHTGNITFWGLSNALSIDGKAYTLVNSVASLTSAIAANPSGNYALAASYDASVDGTYKQNPIAAVFEGNFEGLGNAVSNISMHIASNDMKGFFAEIDAPASVSNFRLRNATLTESRAYDGNPIGLLAGASGGKLFGDDVSGTMTYRYHDIAGGLIGEGAGQITQCSSAAVMKAVGTGGALVVGGLVGQFGGTIADSSASSEVTAKYGTQAAGGLVGLSAGVIRHSHAAGNVTGAFNSGFLGGLVGQSGSAIVDSYATGDVKNSPGSDTATGGLVGLTNAIVLVSFATGKVDGDASGSTLIAGGLVGYLADGGIGENPPSVIDSFATGGVANGEEAGGLIGRAVQNAVVQKSYATGRVLGLEYTGGFSGVGCQCFAEDYWDTTTSGTNNGVGAGDAQGVTGYTSQQLRAGLPPGFDPKIWAEDAKINRGFPYLIANPPPQ